MSKTYNVKLHKDQADFKLKPTKTSVSKPFAKTEKHFSPPKAPRFEKDANPTVEYPHPNRDPYSEERPPNMEDLRLGLTDGLVQEAKPEQKKRVVVSSVVPKVRPRVSEYSRQYPKWDKFPRSKPTLDDSEVCLNKKPLL